MNAKRLHGRKPHGGFTLVELLIAVAIVGILLAIAVPSYQDHLRRGAIEDALSAMSNGRVGIEQFYLDNHTYAGVDAKPPCPADTDKFAIVCAGDAATYSITATGSGTVTNFVYTLDQTGARGTTSPWGNGACWISKKGGSC